MPVPQAKSLARLEDAPLAEGAIVVVATPPKLHAAQTILALERGCAVLCEKPMAATLADAERCRRGRAHEAAARESASIAGFSVRRRPSRISSRTKRRRAFFEVEEAARFAGKRHPILFFRRDVTPGGVALRHRVHTLDLLLWWFSEPTSLEYRTTRRAASRQLPSSPALRAGFTASAIEPRLGN